MRVEESKHSRILNYLGNRDPKNLEENLLIAYDLIKGITSSSDEDKLIRGDIAEFVNKQIVNNIILLNPQLRGKAIYGPVYKGNGKSTELDSILVTSNGVFSIEVKSFYGTYIIDSKGVFNRISPSKATYKVLAQNSSHCRYIHNMIKHLIPGGNPYAVKGIIVLFGDCNFIDNRTDIEKEIFPICYPWDLYKHIYVKPSVRLETDMVYELLLSKADFTKQARENHIAYVKSVSRR